MSDIKTFAKVKRNKRRTGRGQSVTTPQISFLNPNLNSMMYTCSWSESTLTSGTAGAISTVLAPSIQSSPEYSNLATIFNEVRLRRFRVTLMSRRPFDTAVLQARLVIGTNMLFNATTNTLPTSTTEVNNLPGRRYVMSTTATIQHIELVLPNNLEYSNIAADAPATPTPWAGSPGALVGYGGGFTANTDYFIVQAEAVFQLRGRH